jgi:methionyl-tRNA formyltransferase
MKKLSIVYFGTPEFSAYILEQLILKDHPVKAVVTTPDKPAGRGLKLLESEVKKTALKYHIPVLQPEKLKNPLFINELKNLQADIFIVIAFRMLPKEVWDIPPYGTFNIHASLLPKYRGAAPIQHALLNGENKTGVTLFKINEEIDAGKILGYKEVIINEADNFGSLHDKLKKSGFELLKEKLSELVNYSPSDIESLFMDQNTSEATLAPKIKKEDLKINWNLSAREILNRIRAFSPYPGAECQWLKKDGSVIKLKVFEAVKGPNISEKVLPGTGILYNKKILIKCNASESIEIHEVQPEGRKKIKILDFINGNPGITEWRFT